MKDIGVKVYKLGLNSSVQGPTDENGIGEWIHRGEFVKLQDYEKALRRIIELEDDLFGPDEDDY